jgi:hypothetical protein
MRLVWTGSAALVAMFASAQVASATPPPVVRAVIWPNLAITLAPKSVKHGTVVFKIKNRDVKAHEFSINNVESAMIKPHTVVAMTVTFKKPNIYSFTLPDFLAGPKTGYQAVGGQLKVT